MQEDWNAAPFAESPGRTHDARVSARLAAAPSVEVALAVGRNKGRVIERALLDALEPRSHPGTLAHEFDRFLERYPGRLVDLSYGRSQFGSTQVPKKQLLVARDGEMVSRHGKLHDAQRLLRVPLGRAEIGSFRVEEDRIVDIAVRAVRIELEHRLVRRAGFGDQRAALRRIA